MDPTKKKAMQNLAAAMGLNLTSLINIQCDQLLKSRRLVLDDALPVADLDAPTQKAVDEALQDVKAGRVSPAFDNLDDLIKSLPA